jgi:hypothetical protein
MIRITQDERKSNPLLEQLRAELRTKSPAELRAILDAPTETAPPIASRQDVVRYHSLDSPDAN